MYLPSRSIHRLPQRTALALLFVVGSVLVLELSQASLDALRSPRFPTGWLGAGLLGSLLLVGWRDPVGGERSRARLELQVALTGLLLVVCLAHVEFRMPQGLLDVALGLGMLALVASLVFGWALNRRGARLADDRASRLWLAVHSGVTASALVLAGVHGVFSQMHGFFAQFLPESGS